MNFLFWFFYSLFTLPVMLLEGIGEFFGWLCRWVKNRGLIREWKAQRFVRKMRVQLIIASMPEDRFAREVAKHIKAKVPAHLRKPFMEMITEAYRKEDLGAPFEPKPKKATSVEGMAYVTRLVKLNTLTREKVLALASAIGTRLNTLALHPETFPEGGLFPFPVPYKVYMEHMWVVGGTGAGKTQWISQLFLYHAKHHTKPSIVVVDSQGDLIPRLSSLDFLQDRLVVIDPKHLPPIRLFGEGSVEIFDYLFNGIIGADLTAKQAVFFRMMARLLQAIPGATIIDMFRMMQDITPYKKHLQNLQPLQREFFEHDFNSKTFQQTKEQVRYRLNALLENETLYKLLAESGDALDIEKALNTGAVVLIDTSKEYLKSASPAFGRIFIALILQAIYNRASIDESKRYPTFLIVDEAQEYFDQNIDELLTQVRKYKCGCVFAHQYLGQASSQLKESLASNTSIKMVSGVSAGDARSLAPELRTSHDYLMRIKPLHFGTYIRNVTTGCVMFPITPGLLDKEKHTPRIPPPTKPTAPIHTPPTKDDVNTDASQTW